MAILVLETLIERRNEAGRSNWVGDLIPVATCSAEAQNIWFYYLNVD